MKHEPVERHDILNGLALAGVLLVLGLFIVVGVGSCSSALKDVAESEKEVVETTSFSDSVTTPETNDSDEPIEAKEPSEVVVRVANGAKGRDGLATSGTRFLDKEEYKTIQGKNKSGAKLETSVVYYTTGFKANATIIARLLSIEDTEVKKFPEDEDVGVPLDSANILVMLGGDAEF